MRGKVYEQAPETAVYRITPAYAGKSDYLKQNRLEF